MRQRNRGKAGLPREQEEGEEGFGFSPGDHPRAGDHGGLHRAGDDTDLPEFDDEDCRRLPKSHRRAPVDVGEIHRNDAEPAANGLDCRRLPVSGEPLLRTGGNEAPEQQQHGDARHGKQRNSRHPSPLSSSRPELSEARATVRKMAEIIDRLDFVAFGGPIAVGNHGGRADEGESSIQAPERSSRQQNSQKRCRGAPPRRRPQGSGGRRKADALGAIIARSANR